jgi:hypothetical protein
MTREQLLVLAVAFGLLVRCGLRATDAAPQPAQARETAEAQRSNAARVERRKRAYSGCAPGHTLERLECILRANH